MSEATLLDRENYLVAEFGSPPLQRIDPNYSKTFETPPPLDPSSDSSEDISEDEAGGGGRHTGRRSRTKATQSDVVLLNALDPSRPDIAGHARKHALNSESEAEEEDSTQRPHSRPMTTVTLQHAVPSSHAQAKDPKHDESEDVDFEEIMADVETLKAQAEKQTRREFNRKHDAEFSHAATWPSPAETKPAQKYDTRPPPRQSISIPLNEENECLSPALAKHMTNASDAGPENTLPAMQRSPARSHGSNSPEQRQTLPSLQTALFNESGSTPFSARSPHLHRASPASVSHFGQTPSSHTQPSTFSAMSPPGLPASLSAYRSSTTASASTPSDYAITSASALTTPASSVAMHSPHHFPTPTAATMEPAREQLNGDALLSSEHHGDEANGVNGNGIFTNGSFQCTRPDCTAAPFTTQYLLDSHMNVHSDKRPHFCPVKGCARGRDGQGFKRKNEMIRHGLVHTSPGYMCPFCPDQQHKYPRPDNLQRHVKVHHADKDRDDPALRDVLAQRPEGGSRGRRRRLGSS